MNDVAFLDKVSGRCSRPQPACGRAAVDGLTAPPFFAAEWPRRLLSESAPFGMRMGGKSERQALQTLRRYQRNLTQPLKCTYATCAVVGSPTRRRDEPNEIGDVREGERGGAPARFERCPKSK